MALKSRLVAVLASLLAAIACGSGRETPQPAATPAAQGSTTPVTLPAPSADEEAEAERPTVSPGTYNALGPAPTWLTATLDTCVSQRYPSDTTTVPADSLRAHLAGSIRDFGKFSIFVPDAARLSVSDGGTGFSAEWPDCGIWCRFFFALRPDSSGIGVEGIVARLNAEQRRIDSVNNDPKRIADEFDEVDSPPQPITTPTERGYLIDHSCGDCAAAELLFGRSGLIASVGASADAAPGAARHMCTMTAAAKTFTWRN